jgi:four helix bundle protein
MKKDKLKEEFRARIYGYIIRLIKFLNSLPNDSVTGEVKRQLMRSGSSIGANYFEAQSASSKKDYQNFFNHSLKSANESKFWLNVLSDSELVPKDLMVECMWLEKETNEFANIFASSILTMTGKR